MSVIPSMLCICDIISAKSGLELLGASQSKFNDMMFEMGLSAALGPKTEYTLLAPVDTAINSE